MRKYVTTVDDARGIVQVTIADERWYSRTVLSRETGLPEVGYVPSISWLSKFYPKGVGYYKWLAGLGWNEAEAVRQAAAEKGSRVHQAIAQLLDGQTVAMEDAYATPEAETPQPLSLEEYEGVLAFADWWASLPAPEVIAKDFVVWGDGIAGTLDLLARWAGRVYLIDFKTSQQVFPEHELQVEGYTQALEFQCLDHPEPLITPLTVVQPAILQVGYRANQRGWKFTEVPRQPELFAAARAIWAKETAGEKPLRKDYPLRVSLSAPRPEGTDAPGRRTRRSVPKAVTIAPVA